MIVVREHIGRVNTDKLRIRLEVPFGKHRRTENVELIALERSYLRFVKMQFLGNLVYGYLQLTTRLGQALTAHRPLGLFGCCFVLLFIYVITHGGFIIRC